jgi:hypothetical protein
VHVEANLRGGARQPTRAGVAGGNRDRGFGGRPEGDMLGGRAGQHHEPWGVGVEKPGGQDVEAGGGTPCAAWPTRQRVCARFGARGSNPNCTAWFQNSKSSKI